MTDDFDIAAMQRALQLAARGQGAVEPNPMVGCVIARDRQIVAEGWHERYGGPHAEVVALSAMTSSAQGTTAYVTLEPCCHHGKTPPCTDALIAAGVARVVIAQRDPFPQVAGGGIVQLQAAGITVEVGLLEPDARALNAPYLMLVEQQRPWTIAKWAMTLDGKIATYTGDSQWISNEQSRAIVHKLRGRMDAIIVGRGTALRDDPQLTARPAGPRQALRIVLDSQASLPLDSHLVCTARDIPVLIAVGPTASQEQVGALEAAGCEVWSSNASTPIERLGNLWRELGRRRLTNVLVEGGGQLLGSLADAQLIDEVQAFIAPKLIGGATAPSPIGGVGRERMADALALESPQLQLLAGDVYLSGRVKRQ
ncbi:MAG TPA: bifunctional diaminohydroxyphosphoribosylaminopyrimidine deaminase/5-amino-6-(5-phosphoribosylamino)uracil reductase RibD [Pirellulaceae bacterium]|nr:bifunctional diaminohydroxyphosphoribosylaminopyrimidine deaminase/5-amino-6-(5-phosphoribosylamino)uracil reductase RibD [Pirellulaceae bacterium]